MKRAFIVCMVLSLAATASLAAGKVYWAPNGVLISGIDGMGIGDLVTDMRGGAYVLTGDLTRVYLIRVDKEGSLPWGLGGVLVDVAPGSALLYKTYGASDGRKGAILVWSWQYAWGTNLYYQRVDSLGNKTWGSSGQRLTLSDSTQDYWQVASDGQGGAVVAWQERRGGQWDIYAQRVDSQGVRQWGDYGKVVCNAGNNQEMPIIRSLPIIGCIIGWLDSRSDISDVYAQYMDIYGNNMWQSNGKDICSEDSIQSISDIMVTSEKKVFFTWNDKRNGNYDIYAQCVDSLSNPLWTNNGVGVCMIDSTQTGGNLIVYGDREIIVWVDKRNGNFDIYGQDLDTNGIEQWTQNGNVITAADSMQGFHVLIGDGNKGAIICWQDKRSGNYDIYAQHVDSGGNMLWQANGMPVCTAGYGQEWPLIIPSDSGTAIIGWADGRSGWWRAYAQRVGDDGSGVAQGGVAELGVPGLKLLGNRPNPFRQMTTIRYQITEPGDVSLKVYDVAGQCVRVLTNEVTNSGTYEVKWDGRDDRGINAPNGVYFCRLGMGNGTEAMKMIKLR